MQDQLNNPLLDLENEKMARIESNMSSFHIANYNEKRGSYINSENEQNINNQINKKQGQNAQQFQIPLMNKEGSRDNYSNIISMQDSDIAGGMKFIKGNNKGFLYILIAGTCFSISGIFVKKVENDSISEFELMFYRSVFVIFILFIMYKISQREVHPDNELQEYNQNNITYINFSERNFVKIYSMLNGIIVYSYFYGIQQMPLYEAISLQNCSLLFTGIFVCFSATQQKLQAKEIVCMILIAIGVYLISYQAPLKATLFCIFGGSFNQAIIQSIIKKFQSNTQFMTLLFYTSFIQLLVSPILILCFDRFHSISLQDVLLIAIMSFLQIIGTKYLQNGFMAFTEGSFMNFHVQIQIVFALILGHFFLKDQIELHPLLGALFIVASSVMMILKFKQ